MICRKFIYSADVWNGKDTHWVEKREVEICGEIVDEEYGSCVPYHGKYFHFDESVYPYHADKLKPI